MIRLTKGPCPSILVAKGEAWTAEYASSIASGTMPPARYRESSIKQALEAEAHGKCIYCESRVSHTDFGNCEHILPKSKRPDLVCEWSNLGFVCPKCNNAKRDRYDPAIPFVNPFVDDPEDYFCFVGPMIWARLGQARAEATVAALDLRRSQLIEQRSERLEKVEGLIRRWFGLADGDSLKGVLWDEIGRECEPDKEYSAACKALVDRVMPQAMAAP